MRSRPKAWLHSSPAGNSACVPELQVWGRVIIAATLEATADALAHQVEEGGKGCRADDAANGDASLRPRLQARRRGGGRAEMKVIRKVEVALVEDRDIKSATKGGGEM